METNKSISILREIPDPLLRQIYQIANNACNQGIPSIYERAIHEICQLVRPIEIGGSEYHGQYYIQNLPNEFEGIAQTIPLEIWEKWKKEALEIAQKYTKFNFNGFTFKDNPYTISITTAAHQTTVGTMLNVPDHLKIVTCTGIFTGDQASVKSQVADYEHNLYRNVVGILSIPGTKPLRAKVMAALLYPQADPIRYELTFVEEE